MESLIKETRQDCAGQPQQEAVEKELGYFERNSERMRYGTFRKKGYFIGSGVVEAGCKTVVGYRLKQSGMFWTVRGVNAIVALRCHRFSDKFEDYWASRSFVA